MSNLSQHDPFYVGPLFGQRGTYVKPDEIGWAGGTSTAIVSGGGVDNAILTDLADALTTFTNNQGITNIDLNIFTLEIPVANLPFTFTGTSVKSFIIENKSVDVHISLDGINGIRPLGVSEFDAEDEFFEDKSYTISGVTPQAITDGDGFVYIGAPSIDPVVLSASGAIIRVTAIAENLV